MIIVYNDHAYGAEVHHFGRGADLETVIFPDRDLAAIARGFGADGITVRGGGRPGSRCRTGWPGRATGRC